MGAAVRGASLWRTSSTALGIAIVLALGATGALAQQAQDQGQGTGAAPEAAQNTAATGGLQEVVVTATKRTQNVQNIPITVQAFSTAQLQENNLTNLTTLTALTPGADFEGGAPFSGDRSVLSASIRGIGQNDFAFNLNPSVGVYVDGVFLARTIGANVDLLDVDRVEILKGAQGTLFGANTIGGAINIVTHTPGDDLRFIGTATGGRFNERNLGFTVDIPLIKDKLLTSFTVSSQQQDGYQKVIPYPTNGPVGTAPFVVDPQTAYPKAGYATGDSYGGTGVTAMRAKVLYNATDKLNFTFTADWTHENQTALPEEDLQDYAGNLSGATFATLYDLCIGNGAAGVAPYGILGGVCSQPRAHVPGLSVGGAALLGAGYAGVPVGAVPFPGVDPCYNYNNIAAGLPYCGSNQPRLFIGYHDPVTGLDPVTQTGNLDTTYAAGRPDFAYQNVFGFSLTGVYDLTDTLQLKSITGYRQDLWQIGTQLDGTPETMLEVTDQQHQWQVSQEFQLLGKALDNKLNWVYGLYYFNEYGYVHDYVPFESLLYVYDGQANDVQNTYYATYLHLDYNLNDHWEFIAGGRYTDSQTYFLGGQGDLNDFPFGSYCWLNSCGGAPPFTQIIPNQNPPGASYYLYFPDQPDSQAWHVFTPTGSIDYHFNNNVMAYVSWGKGFQQGGWTTRLSAAIPSPTDARFGPEYAKQWELGLKSEWFDHRLLVNAAAFYTNFNDIQLNIQQGISPVYQNAGNAIIRGGELEFQSLVGGGLQLNGSASYIDAYYTSVLPSANIPEFALPDGRTVCPATVVSSTIGTLAAGCNVYDGPTVAGLVHGAGSLPGDPAFPVVYPTQAKLPYTPTWKLTFDPSYDFSLPNEATIRFLPIFTYTSSMFMDSLNTPLLHRPATRELDASIHYISPDATYDFAIGGTNLTNDRFITAGAVNYGAGVAQGYINAPIEWYATIRVMLQK